MSVDRDGWLQTKHNIELATYLFLHCEDAREDLVHGGLFGGATHGGRGCLGVVYVGGGEVLERFFVLA